MTEDELDFLWRELRRITSQVDKDDYPIFRNADNFRAARIWISSQRRRFNKLEDAGCCGSFRGVVTRYNCKKLRTDIYLIGFNYGH